MKLCDPKLMMLLKWKVAIVFLVVVLVIVTGGIFVYFRFTTPRQSSVRLTHALRLKELLIAVESYRNSYEKMPDDLKALESVGLIFDSSHFEKFRFLGGRGGIIAFQQHPFRRVKEGEPWGGHGEVAKHEIPAARLVLFADGSIKFVEESDFQRTYAWLVVQPETE